MVLQEAVGRPREGHAALQGRVAAAAWCVGLRLQSLTSPLSTDIVQMHIETLDAVHRESKRLPPIQKVGARPAAEGSGAVWGYQVPSCSMHGPQLAIAHPIAKAAAPQPVGG